MAPKIHYKLGNIPLLFLHKCCSCGFKQFEAWLDNEKELNHIYNIELVGIFNIKDKGYDIRYKFDLKDLDNHAYIILPETDERIKIDVIDKHY